MIVPLLVCRLRLLPAPVALSPARRPKLPTLKGLYLD